MGDVDQLRHPRERYYTPPIAALRSIVRRDTGEGYEDFLTRLAKASGIGTPTRADLARLDRKRKKQGSNDEWTHPRDPDAKIT
jgi:transposase